MHINNLTLKEVKNGSLFWHNVAKNWAKIYALSGEPWNTAYLHIGR